MSRCADALVSTCAIRFETAMLWGCWRLFHAFIFPFSFFSFCVKNLPAHSWNALIGRGTGRLRMWLPSNETKKITIANFYFGGCWTFRKKLRGGHCTHQRKIKREDETSRKKKAICRLTAVSDGWAGDLVPRCLFRNVQRMYIWKQKRNNLYGWMRHLKR